MIEIANGVARHPDYRMAEPVDFSLCDGEQMAVVGDNGAGKSMFVDILTGKHPLLGEGMRCDFGRYNARMLCDNIKYVAFKDTYGTGDDNQFYQLRWNTHEEDCSPEVGDALDEAFGAVQRADDVLRCVADEDKALWRREREGMRRVLCDTFDINSIRDRKITHLSSGELRKFHLTRALLSNPRVVIIDNPFIGLDAAARKQLTELVRLLIAKTGMQVVLVLSRPEDIPDFVTHVVEVKGMVVGRKVLSDEYMKELSEPPLRVLPDELAERLKGMPSGDAPHCDVAIDFKDVTIRYGERTILDQLSFTVRCGERWALTGRNGSGKSTLLSIVCADNLQAYANKVVLFDKVRGTGESIWEIKKNIGYVSPELHRSYYRDYPAVEIVASGLSDSIGLYMRPKREQMDTCLFWMDMFGIRHLANTSFLRLSSGEQRLVLLARAFVKDPSLLILDEPFHGLDPTNRRRVLDVIEAFSCRRGKTLIVVSHYMSEIPACVDKVLDLSR